MLLSTQGLVLHTTKYSETSIIAKVFTRQLGLKSYIIKGVRSNKGRVKQNLFQTLSYLDMVVYNNPKTTINYIKELRVAEHFNSIQTDNSRMAVVFFMNELLYKSLQEEEPNEHLFDYVVETLRKVNLPQVSLAPMPIQYMLRTASYLGIEPMNNYSSREPYFNLKEGRFLSPPSSMNPDAPYYLSADESNQLHGYLQSIENKTDSPTLPRSSRTHLINTLIDYYQTHLTSFANFKSHEILHSVLD